MVDDIQLITTRFYENIDSVYNLMNFDEVILNIAISGLSTANENLKKNNINNPKVLLDKTIRNLKNIRDHNTLKPKYDLMQNQCIVLLVSYFGSAIEEIFEHSLNYRLMCCDLGKLKNEELKITLGELADHRFNLFGSIGEVVTNSKEISFQDMQSIKRAFYEYFNISIEKDNYVNNIIMSQACRHIIVHNGSIVNEKMGRQIAQAIPRDLKQTVTLNEKIQFSAEEIKIVGAILKTPVIPLKETKTPL